MAKEERQKEVVKGKVKYADQSENHIATKSKRPMGIEINKDMKSISSSISYFIIGIP
jgi:hypothetical protein